MMLKIHKTHSKLELCQIINIYNIDIINPGKYKKADLALLLQNKLSILDALDIPEYNNTYHFINITDLNLYLTNINPKKILTVKQKQNVILVCKKLKHFCNNNYLVNNSEYTTLTDVYKDAKYIESYGDIPSVRKVCKLLNDNIHKPFLLQPIITQVVQKELDKKNLYRKTKIYSCTFTHGKFTIDFD